MGKKFFEYSQNFDGKSYTELTEDEKKEYHRMTTSNFYKTRVVKSSLEFYRHKEQDMMILYFLNNVVAKRQPFIKRIIWEYMLKYAPEYTNKLGEFKYDHDVEKRVHNRLYEYNGVKNTLNAWSQLLNIDYCTLKIRLNRLNWGVEKAFTEPIKPGVKNDYKPKPVPSKEYLVELTEKIKKGEIKFPIKEEVKRTKQRDYSGIKFATKNKDTRDISLEELNNETFKDVLYKKEIIK